MTFPHLIVDEGTFLAKALNQGIVDRCLRAPGQLVSGLRDSGPERDHRYVEAVRWVVTILCIDAAEIAVFLVISFGYVAVGVRCSSVRCLFLFS